MIDFHFETDFTLDNTTKFTDWITRIIKSEDSDVDQIDFIFCDDEYLLNINQQYLHHDDFTDIITFDYSSKRSVAGDIFISIDRVKENAEKYKADFEAELKRVMAHGVLHLLGYNDKTEKESETMREKENEKMDLFHVEQ